MHSAGILDMCFGSLDTHICRHIGALNEVLGVYGIGQINLEGRMLIFYCS